MQQDPLVIVGGGFAGVRLAQRLAKERNFFDREILLLEQHTHHVFTPLLYEVASTKVFSPEETCRALHGVTFHYNTIFPKGGRVRVIQTTVTTVDAMQKTVTCADGTTYHASVLVLALGSDVAYYDIPGLQENAYILKSRTTVIALRQKFAEAVALLQTDDQAKIHLVIGGAGATGVELAAEWAVTLRAIQKKCPRIAARWTITLVHAAPRVLNFLPEALSCMVEKRLASLGVQVLLDTAVKSVTAESVTVGSGTVLPVTILAWTGGVQPNPLYRTMGVPTDAKGAVIVDGQFHVPTSTDVFVLGDGASLTNPVTNERFPQYAQSAIHSADIVADVLHAGGKRSPVFSFPFYTHVYPVGGRWALAVFSWGTLRGVLGWLFRYAANVGYYVQTLPLRHALRAAWIGGFVYTRNEK